MAAKKNSTELALMDSFKIANRYEGIDPELMAELQDELGDLELEFSNGVRFESFTADSLKCEVWRLVDYLTGEQLVTLEK